MSATSTARHLPRRSLQQSPREDTSWSTDATPSSAAVVAVKALHTAVWVSTESCVAYVLWAGITGRPDKRVGMAAAVVAGESLVFVGNGFRCPLTELETRYGAESGSVTDIYLPRWFAHNLPAIHAPLLALMVWLHVRHLRARSVKPLQPLGERPVLQSEGRGAPRHAGRWFFRLT